MLVLLPAPRAYLAKQLMSRVVVGNIHASGAGFEQPNLFTIVQIQTARPMKVNLSAKTIKTSTV